MLKINILADAKFPLDRKGMRSRLEGVLAKYRLTERVELAVLVVGKRKMTELNKKYLEREGPTDVLSFPLVDAGEKSGFIASPDGVLRLGDIVVCYPVAKRQAFLKQIKIDRQLQDYAEHGLMHLLGFHHE